jgi:hypothetical protein
VAQSDGKAEQEKVAHEILSYLAEHPHAEDSIEGITEWWLLDRKIKHQTALVEAALDSLIAKGLVLEHTPPGARRASIRVNGARRKEIESYLKKERDGAV